MNFNLDINIVKTHEDEQKVWGIFSLSTIDGKMLVDNQGHMIEPGTLQKMAHGFALNARIAGREHQTMGVGQLIESFVFTNETSNALEEVLKSVGVENPVIKPGAEFWAGAFHISDPEVWELIKSGEFESFSIGGMAQMREVDVNTFADV